MIFRQTETWANREVGGVEPINWLGKPSGTKEVVRGGQKEQNKGMKTNLELTLNIIKRNNKVNIVLPWCLLKNKAAWGRGVGPGKPNKLTDTLGWVQDTSNIVEVFLTKNNKLKCNFLPQWTLIKHTLAVPKCRLVAVWGQGGDIYPRSNTAGKYPDRLMALGWHFDPGLPLVLPVVLPPSALPGTMGYSLCEGTSLPSKHRSWHGWFLLSLQTSKEV